MVEFFLNNPVSLTNISLVFWENEKWWYVIVSNFEYFKFDRNLPFSLEVLN